MKRRTVSCLSLLAAALAYTSIAAAGPIPPGTPGTFTAPCPVVLAGCGIGESDIVSPFSGSARLDIDWIVLAPGSIPAAWVGILGINDVNAPAAVTAAMVATQWLYLYQAENTNPQAPPGGLTPPGCDSTSKSPPPTGCIPSGVTMATLTLSVPMAGPGGDVTLAGVLQPPQGNPGDDLDLLTAFHPAHSAGNIGTGTNIADDPSGPGTGGNEEEGICPVGDFAGDMDGAPTNGPGSGFCINPADPITPSISVGSVSWTNTPRKPPHHETPTLFFFATDPPVYGSANMIDASPPSPWATGITTDGFTGDPVPVPAAPTAIPEPTTLLLFGGGMVTLGLLRRKMKR